MLAHASSAIRELGARLGREDSMHSVHAAILRAAHSFRPVVESGAVLAACSDEFNGEVRGAFERDVARQLLAPDIPGVRRVFAVSNLGGRIEPGAIALADQHFSARSRQTGEKLLLIEIAGHVGRRETPEGMRWGELDRFGTPSPCCGALRLLLDGPESANAVRFPWFDQLTAFFGPKRLATLRADESPHAMLRAAVVHTVLQSETALVDLLREPPTTSTHVLLVALVIVNRRGTDNAIPVGLHHLHFKAGEVEIGMGAALRSTPEEIEVDASQAYVSVSSPFEPEDPTEAVAAAKLPPAIPANARLSALALEGRVCAHLTRHRRQMERLLAQPDGLNVYSRAHLRAFLQRLSVLAPEVALAALAAEGEREVLRPARLHELTQREPSGAEARRILHDLEPTLQQLGHEEARELLQILLSRQHPLLGAG